MCKIVKKLWSLITPAWKFFFLIKTKSDSTEYFVMFPVYSSAGDKKIFWEKMGSLA